MEGCRNKKFFEFDKIYKDTKVIELEENYRSTQNILSVASDLISNNQNRVGKTLKTNSENGELVNLSCFRNGKERGYWFKRSGRKKFNEHVLIK